MFWATFWLWAASTALQLIMAKGPGNAKASSIDGNQVPTAEEGKPIYVLLGTGKVSGPNVTWWGDVSVKAIKKKTSGFFGLGGKTYTVGHKYYIGMQMGLCSGPIDAVEDIIIGGKSLKVAGVAFPRTFSESGALISVNLPNLFGGEESEGGIAGDIAFYFGSRTQTGDSYLASKLGKVVPGYRDLCYAVLRKLYIGTQAYLKNWEWVLRATPVIQGMNPLNVDISGDINPAHAIAYLLCADQDNGGLGRSPSRLDLTSFNATATRFYSEGLGVSVLLDSEQGADEWIEEILGTVDAVLFTDPSTGLYTLKPIRNDYVVEDLPLLDESHINSFKRKMPSWSETVNRVVVDYVDRAAGFVTGTVQEVSLANKEIQGRDIQEKVSFPALSNRTNAQMACGRWIRTRSYPLMTASIVADRTAWGLRKGSAFRVTWAEDQIVDKVFRVNTIRYGALEAGAISIEATEDIFGALESAYVPPPASEWTDPLAPPVAAAAQALVEVPYWVAGGEIRNVLALGARADASTQLFEILVNEGSGYLAEGILEPIPTGLLTAPWTCRTPALDLVGFTVGSGQDLDELPLHNTNADGRALGANLFVCGSEWGSWTTCTDNGDGTFTVVGILRGILDTVPEDHAAGDRVWFLTAAGGLMIRKDTGEGGTATPGAPGVDGRGYTWRGAWSAATSYSQDDTCEHSGSMWVALQASLNQAPPTLPVTANAYWELAAKAGRDGQDGLDGVSTFERTTVSLTTAALAPNADAAGALTVKRTANLLSIETDYPAWVRVYGASAERSADSTRIITEDPEPGAGVFLDSSTEAGALRVNQAPVPVFVNHDDPPGDVAYVAIRNLDTVSRAITLTLVYLPLEA